MPDLHDWLHGWPIELAGGFLAYCLHVTHDRLFHVMFRLFQKGWRR